MLGASLLNEIIILQTSKDPTMEIRLLLSSSEYRKVSVDTLVAQTLILAAGCR